MKNIVVFCMSVLLLGSCKKKDSTPEEYFSFDADGVHYEYPVETTPVGLFGGGAKTLGAGPLSGNLGYDIYAFTQKDPAARGEFRFTFASNEMPDRDTIILDGVYNNVSIENFNTQGNSYVLAPPLTGKIVFTERTDQKLTGTFEFDASQSGGAILHITNGKFSIIPSNK